MSLQYYKNPFTRNSAQPKLPDGKFDNSIGLSRRASKVVATPPGVGSQFISPLYVVVIPGLVSQWATYTTEVTLPTEDTEGTVDAQFSVGQNDKWNHLWEWDVPVPGETFLTLKNAPLLWRMVSCGMRVVPISADAESEGFMETFTVPMSKKRIDWVVKDGNIIPSLSYVKALEENIERFRDHSSYWTASYREVENYQFANTVNDPDHKPIEVGSKYLMQDPGAQEVVLSNSTNLPEDRTESSAVLDETFDSNFNLRIFRIQAKPAEKFLLTLQSNFELHFGIGNPIRAFQTENRATGATIAATTTAMAVDANQNGVQTSTNNRPTVTPQSNRKTKRELPTRSSKWRKLE